MNTRGQNGSRTRRLFGRHALRLAYADKVRYAGKVPRLEEDHA
jgi:hypothetical protein